jgi:ketosteroid isomerase-like protein
LVRKWSEPQDAAVIVVADARTETRGAKSEVERLIDHGEQVVALVHGRYRLSEQGVPIEQHYGDIWTLRKSKAIHARAVTRNEALKAVGLEA